MLWLCIDIYKLSKLFVSYNKVGEANIWKFFSFTPVQMKCISEDRPAFQNWMFIRTDSLSDSDCVHIVEVNIFWCE